MMCHIAKIMTQGDTFRMNVGDTKPYNADFDGDEMNLHMPQDVMSETELLNLAAVPYQIISPANTSSTGIFFMPWNLNNLVNLPLSILLFCKLIALTYSLTFTDPWITLPIKHLPR